jgi:Glyoxalase-like domain
MTLLLDHVTLGASSLEAGAAWLQRELGIDMPPGGKHPDMSTHNRLLNVGGERFLELLAVDPEAPPVPHRRWFGLDDPAVTARLAQHPRGIGWVVRTGDIAAVKAASPVDLGRTADMSRGGRTWRLTVREDGMMPFDGLVPAFIEWSPGPHPSQGMQFLGPELVALELRHPDADGLRRTLQALGVDGLARVERDERPSLSYAFRLPDGSLRTVGA